MFQTGDAIKQCALELSQYLKDFSFGLEDRFCDDQDLKQGLSSMKIPEPWLNFFGYLFQFNPNTYQNAADQVQHNKERSEELHDMNDDDYDIEVEKTQTEESTLSVSRCRKIQSLFQVMFYIKHNGRKKTPMHVMNAESVHSLGRGGKIVTQMLNREALCISYPELRRLQHDVASFTAEKNIEIVSLPSHFDPGEFTYVAIINWDHGGMNVSEHDTVTVLFQNKPEASRGKPNVTDTSVQHGPQSFKETLKCQLLSEFIKPSKKPKLPADYQVASDDHSTKDVKLARTKDTIWSLARIQLDTNGVNIYPDSQAMPSWGASNSVWTMETVPLKHLAFLSVLPHPITDFSSVYTAMTNCVAMLSQLISSRPAYVYTSSLYSAALVHLCRSIDT